MTDPHLFWKCLTWVCVGWYGSITIYIAIRGSMDIREMLRRLRDERRH